MVFERFWLGLSLVFLGSCAPLTPPNNTSITIYTNANGQLVERKITSQGDEVCRTIKPDIVMNYVKPKLPDLSGVGENLSETAQAKMIIAELNAHIRVLRSELDKVVQAANCGQKIP